MALALTSNDCPAASFVPCCGHGMRNPPAGFLYSNPRINNFYVVSKSPACTSVLFGQYWNYRNAEIDAKPTYTRHKLCSAMQAERGDSNVHVRWK